MSDAAPGVRLSQLVSDLAPVLAHAHVPDGTGDVVVTAAEIVGSVREEFGPGSLVLDTVTQLDALNARATGRLVGEGVVALVVREGTGTTASRSRARVGSSRLPVLVVTADVSWFQVATIVRERLAATALGMADRHDAAIAGHNLTKVAEAVSTLIRAPVIIQDPDFEILAYSQHQQDADAARAATVLGHALPDRYRKVLDKLGAIERVYGSVEPQYIEFGGELSPRLAVAVRSGQDIMGSMWAVVPGPVDEHQIAAFADAAGVAALALLQERSRARARITLRDGLLVALLSDGHVAAEAKARLGLSAQPLSVLAVTCDADTSSSVLQRVGSALDLHLRAAATHAGATLIDGLVLGVVPGEDTQALRRSMERFVGRMRRGLLVGIGSPQVSASGVRRSRREAEVIVSALGVAGGDSRVATLDEAMPGITLVGVRDFYRRQELDLPFGPIAEAAAYDRRTGSELVPTLAAFVSCLGDVVRTAALLNVHANTVRYRLGRLKTTAGLDHLDADQMFMASLQLRLMSLKEVP